MPPIRERRIARRWCTSGRNERVADEAVLLRVKERHRLGEPCLQWAGKKGGPIERFRG